jgi:hypothetical protein
MVHFMYKLLQAFAYSKGSFTVVYPVVRGTGPVFTVKGLTFCLAKPFRQLNG